MTRSVIVLLCMVVMMTSFQDGLTNGLRSAACSLVGGRPEWLGQYLDWGTPSGLVPTTRALRRWVSDTTGLGTLTLGAITVTGTGAISINPSGSGSLISPLRGWRGRLRICHILYCVA